MEIKYLYYRHKLRKLVALVSLAYAYYLSVGTLAEHKLRPRPAKTTATVPPASAATALIFCANLPALAPCPTSR